MPYSVAKPFAALTVLHLVQRGLVELDAPMQRYWPELSAPVSVRQVLSHRAGLVLLDEELATDVFFDWSALCRQLAEQCPAFEPGSAYGESALFYGHLLGEIVRRVDGRSLGRYLRDEICRPLGLDFHIGLREEELGRVADLTGFGPAYRQSQPDRPPPFAEQALANPPGARDLSVVNSEAWRRAEIPAINGHGTARAVAGMYAALTRGEILAPDLLAEMTRGEGVGEDLVVGGGPRTWGLGVAVEDDGFGMGGLGGSYGWWSTEGDYAVAFLTGFIATHARGDRLESAVREVLGLPPLG